MIPFHKHDYGELEIEAVSKVLRSGWINTGPMCNDFETALSEHMGVSSCVAVNSATAAMFLALRGFGVGPGDEVITTAYTFSATSAAIIQCGARPVFADVDDNFLLDPEKVREKVSGKTKAILAVDFGGWQADYASLKEIASSTEIDPQSTWQEKLRRPLVVADGAHFSGGVYHLDSEPDVSCLSFHAVKNITSADGGAIALYGANTEFSPYLRRMSLHGMDKSSQARLSAGGWSYDVTVPGFKMNMTDIEASLALIQLRRLKEFDEKKSRVSKSYVDKLKPLINNEKIKVYPIKGLLPPQSDITSKHLFAIRAIELNEDNRNNIISKANSLGVHLNVHFKPLPMLSYYKNNGFQMHSLSNSYDMYKNEISLPFYSQLDENSISIIGDSISKLLTSSQLGK